MNKIQKPEKLIRQLTANTLELLNDNWSQIESLAAADDELKIAMTHTITNIEEEISAKTTITFGCRIKDQTEHVVDTNQTELPLEVPKRGFAATGRKAT